MKKKIHMIAALLAMLLPTVQAWGSSYYYAYTKVVRGTGCGKVYVNNASTTANPDYKTDDYTSGSQGGKDKSKTGYKFYVYAQNKHGYKFKTWSVTCTDNQSSNKGSATITSGATTENGCLVTVTTGSQSFNEGGTQDTTATATATYEQCTSADPHYTLTMGNEAGTGSYTITGPVDFPAISPGGSTTVWFNDVVSFAAMPAAGYDFVRWRRVDASGTSYFTDEVLSTQSFTSDTTISAEFKKQVTVDAVCQGSVGGSYKANGTTISGRDQTLSQFGSITVSLSNPVANDGYAFYGWYILHPNGVKEYLSYYTSVSTGEKKENITIGAEFREVQDCTIDFIAPVDGKITYAISGGNSGVVEGANVSETVPAGANVTLTATSDLGSRRAKWYTKDDRNRKTYFSIDNSLTKTFASSVALGVDFIPVNTNIVNAIEAAQSSETHEAILAADAEIVLGTSVEIPAGITIDLNGHTIYVDGTLTVNGVLTGGTVSKCTKLIRQTGNGLEPIVADNISYWDTRVVTSQASVSGFSNPASHLTIVNGYGTPIRGTLSNNSPAAIVCDIDLSSGAAVNTITKFVGDYTAIGGTGGAILATGGNSKLVVQLTSSVTLEINDFPSGSGWRSTSSGKEQTKLGKGYRIDCAHNSITLKYEVTNASVTYFINAESASRTSGLQLGSTENFIHCSTVSQRINASNAGYAVKFNVYDCGNPSVTFDGSNAFSGDNCGVNFRSGGPYTIPSSGNSNYHVFGGFYTSKPDTGRIAKGISGRAFYQHADTYWYLEENLDKNVAEIGGIKKYALIEAFQEAITGDVSATTITLLRDCSLDEPVVIPADRSIRLELAGCTVTAPNGFIVNHGSFEIGDKYGSLTYCGVVTETGNVFVNEDGGRIVVAYGKYDGGVLLKAGSEFTTHHGNFTGAISFGEGVAVKASVAKIYGGKFSTDVADCLCDGYQQVNGYVGLFPYADIQDQSVSGYEFGYQVQAMADRDLGLYNNSQTMRDASYTAENWFRRAQLYSQSAPYLSYTIDCIISFDRKVTKDSITAYGKTAIGFPRDLPEDVAAGVDYRVLSKELASRSQYQKSYSQFLTEDSVKTLVCAVKNNKSDNDGTFCRLRVDLCSGANRYDVSNLKSIHTIGHRCFVFGADSNVAMIRPETGAATFYATLEDAMDAVANGGTVMLANDNTAPLKLEKAGTYTFDTMGFKHSGGVELGEGLSIKSETPVVSSVATLIPDAVATTYVVVAGSAATAVDAPTAVSGLVYDGTEKTGVAAGTGYTLSGNTATAVGSYTATATLEDGYVWSDDSSDAKEISWSIGKASLTATAENKSVIRGETVSYTITYSGFVNGEDVSALTAAPTASCDYNAADMSATATSYPITLSGGSASNYDLTLVSGTLTVNQCVAIIEQGGETGHYTSLSAAVEAASGNTITVTVTANDTETVTLPQGKTLVVTVNDGIEANVTVNPAEGEFVEAETSGTTTTYVSKKITVEMKEPTATVAVTKIDNGTESDVTDTAEINAAVAKMTGNNDVPRTDNTDKLDVLDKITVSPTKIVEEIVESKTIIRSATFDVTPAYNAGQSLAEGQKLKFRLPVDAAATQLAAIVYHSGAQFGIFAVQTYNNEKFVEVESDTFSPYGYELLDGETANPVAAIGTTGYASLAAAVAAVPADGTQTTITMIADETIEGNTGVMIGAVQNIVQDLNGHTVQMSVASADERWLIKNEGSLTVKDSAENGKLLMNATGQSNTGVRKSVVKNMGSLTVEGGTIEMTYSGTTKEEPTAVLNDAAERATLLAVTGGTIVNSANRGTGVFLAVNDTFVTTFDMQDGRVEGYGAAVRYYFDDNALTDAKLVFKASGGTINGRGMYGVQGMTTSSKDWTGISFEISGGTFESMGLLNRKHVIAPMQGTVSVSGGTFNGDVYIYGHNLNITDGNFNGAVTLHRVKESLASASISGGQFKGALTIAETTNENTTNPYYNAKFVSGGIYGTAPAARNVVDGNVVVDNTDSNTQGDYPKAIGGAVASVVVDENTTYYATLADAIAAANEAGVDEITVLNGATESPDSAWKVSDGKLVRKVYVAQIGETKYESLAAAVAAANADDTVQLLTDVALDAAVDIDKSVTLDLNGKTVSSSAANEDGYAIGVSEGTVVVTGNGTVDAGDDLALYVTGGSVTIANGTFSVIGVDDGNVTLTDGTYGAILTAGGTTVVNGGTFSDTVDVEGGAVTINNGAFTAADNVLIVTDAEGMLTVNGGTFAATPSGEGDPIVVYVESGEANLTGGTFTGGTIATDEAETGTLTVSGGFFSSMVPEEYCANGYIPTAQNSETGLYSVTQGAYYDVWVGGTQLSSLNAADVFGDGKVSYDDATKTLTLNGYTYSGTGYGDSAVYIGDMGGATFNVVVAGENSLTSTAAYGYAIRSVGTGAVTVTGSGSDPSLALTVPSAYDTGYAVSVKGTSATFKDLSMAVTGYLGIVVNGNNAAGDALTIDNCDIVFDGTAIDQAIWVYNPMGDGTVSIENGSSLTGKGAILVYGYGTSGGDANLSIQDSTVSLTGATTASASGSSRHAIEVLSNVGDSVLTIDNSTVTVTASNGLHPNGNGPDGINVGSQMSANGKGLAKIDIKNGSVVTATGNANGVNLFTWGDSSNVNLCGAELSVVDSTLNASATHATGGHYGIVAYAYQKGDTSVVFENSTVNASAPASAGIYVGAGEDFNADVGNLSYEAIDSDVTTSGPYGLVVSTISADGNNTSVLQTVDISGGSFTCNGLLFVYGDDGENTASVRMSDVTAQIGTTTATDEPVLGTVTTGELSIDSGDYTILHAADLDAFDVADGNISGGNFNEPVPEELCADTYIPTPQDPVTGKYTVKQGSYVAQIGDVKYETFAEAIVAAEAYKTANGDYPVITVLDATAEQTNPDWKIADGKLVHKVYVAQIGTTKYETVEAALTDAQGSGATIEILANSTETPAHALEVLMGGNITLTAATPVRVEIAPTAKTSSVDTDGMAYIRSASAAARCTFTVGENVTLAFPATAAGKGAMYIGYSSTTPADMVINGRLELYEPYVGSLSTLTVNPSGSIKSISECLIVRWGATVDIVGTGAEWSDANPQAEFAYVSLQGGVTTLKDTYAKGGAWVQIYDRNNKAPDYATKLVLDNAVLATSKINNQAVIELDVDSQIVTPVVQNTGSINIDATGITQAAKIIDYTGSGTLALADYGTVTVTAGEAYVEGNDLWVKKPAVAQIVRGGNVVAKYESLVAAYNASESGDTIELLGDDRSLSADDNAELTITKSITITGPVDANGDPLYTIYGKNDSNGYNDIFIRAGASDMVTISNVNVAQFGNQASLVMDVAPIYVGGGNAAKVVLDNVHVSEFLRIGVMMSGSGEFEVRNCYIDGARERSDTCSYGIEVHRGAHGVIADTTIENVSSTSEGWGAACVTINGQGAVSITNCTLVGGVNCDGIGTSENATEGACTSVVTIEDSTIDADCAMGMNVDGAQFVVKSGTYSGYLGLKDGSANAAPYSISGGMFEYEVPEEFCASGFIPAANTDTETSATYPYTVKEGAYVAQIGDVKYETFAEAIAAAEAYKTTNGDYPVITVLDATAEQTNPDWKIADGKLVHKVYVAQIGTTKYETLAEAVASATSGATIEMIADDRLTEELVISRSVTITGAVDANGKPLYTIYGKPTDNYNVDVFVKNASSAIDVTIQNVNISEFGHQYKTSTGNAALYVSRSTHADTHVLVSNVTVSAYNNYAIIAPQGHLEVVDCAIDGSKDSSYGTFATGGIWSGDMFDDLPSSTVSVVRTSIINTDSNMPGVTGYAIDARAGSTVTVTDCTITNVHDGIAAAASQESGDGEASVSVSGTTVTASRNALAITGNPQIANTVLAYLEVKSGMYVGAVTIPDEFVDDGIIEISGGVFDRAVPEDYCASGFIPAANTDAETSAAYPYTVKEGSYVAQIVRGGEVIAKYETFTNALEVAESGDTVQLLANVEDVTETFVLHSKNITIDGQGLYSITAGENTEPRGVVQSYGGARNMFVVQSGNVTFKDITLDGGETHYYTFLVQAKNGTTTFDNVSLLHGGEADTSGTAGVGYGAAVQVDGATVLVTNSFYACTGTNVNDVTTGVFPFTALLYQSGGIHFADGVTAGIGDDLLLVGMVGAVDVSTEAGREQVNEMLEAMNVPAGYYPYTLKLGDSSMTSFTGASPLGWNDIIDYGKEIMTTTSALGMEMNPATTPVEVGLLEDTVLPDTFVFEDSNFTVDGNGYALAGTIEYTDNAGQIHDIVMGTEGNALVLDMTDTTKPIVIGSGITVSNVTVQMTAEQATAGTPVIIWDAAHGVDAPENEAGVTVQIVDDHGDSTGVTKELIWDDEMGMAYIGPCEARLTGPMHDKPIYTTLADAIAHAEQSGDTVTLLMNVTNVTATYEISKQDLVIDGAGYTVAAAPVTEHRNMFEAWSGSKNMFKLQTGNITFRNITLDGDETHAYTFLISADNSSVAITTENVRLIHGGEISKDSDNATVTPGNGYGAAIHLNNGAHLIVSNGFYACTGTNVNGVTTGVFPFTAILPENLEAGTSVAFELTGNPNDPANVDIGDDLLLVGMIGDLIEQYGIDNVQGILNYMKVPSRFIPYTLTLADGSAYAFTGASPRRWNEIIDYGKDIMDVATANGFSGLDKDTTPVEVGLATDTVLPAGADGDGYDFLYEDSNFSINGNGNALSGTIKFTDDANGGLMHDIDLGTDDAPLTLDLSATTNAVMLGGDVIISNVVVKLTEDQATLGKVVFEWDSGETPPDDEQGVEVTVVNNSGTPTGETKGLIWDEEYGVAYIGPCEARLTGTTHETPVYTSLANALDIAKDNDKVELLTNAVLSAVQGVGSDVTLDLAGYKVSVNGAKGLLVTNATLVIADTSVKTNGTICAGDEASPASLIESGNGGVVNIPTGIFVAASGQNVLLTSDNGAIAVSGGYFSNPVLSEHCAESYMPVDAEAGAPQPYTVAEFLNEFRYPIDGSVGVPVERTWLAQNFSDIYSDSTKPVLANVTNALVEALSKNGANEMPRWESYVLGLDPTDVTARLRLTATSKDAATVTIIGLIDMTKFPKPEGTTITFRLAEVNPDGTKKADIVTDSDVPSFDVLLEEVVGKELAIFADIAVEGVVK